MHDDEYAYGIIKATRYIRQEVLNAIRKEINNYTNKSDKEVAQSIYKIIAEMRFS